MVAQGLRGHFIAVRRQVVEDHNGSGFEFRNQYLAHVGGKGWTIHRPLDDPRCDQGVLRQPRDQRLRAPASERGVHRQAVAPFRPAAQAGQVRFHRRFINEDNAIRSFRDGLEAMPEPVGALLPFLGAAALGRDQRLFLYVNPSRDSRFAMDE